MTRTITYGTLWHRSAGRMPQEFTLEQARARHEAREKYVALIHEDGVPVVAVEVVQRPPVVGVFFLDGEGRDTAEYVFVAHPEGGDLWLEQTFVREIVDRRTVVAQEWVVTRPDGRFRREVFSRKDSTHRATEGRFDPAQFPELREPMPVFGEYTSISRWERATPGVPTEA
jgi:hypothetical protein